MSSTSQKRGANDDDKEEENGSMEQPPLKKTCIRSSRIPDVTIRVGGIDFLEYSHSLCCWSNYFDRALESGMKESQTNKFDFPDRDPKEWEWIVSLMAPMSPHRVTPEKLGIALDWFEFLASDCGLEGCDKMLCGEVLPDTTNNHNNNTPQQEDFALVMKYLALAFSYSLKKSMIKCLDVISNVFLHNPTVLDKKSLITIIAVMKEHEECCSALWEPLKSLLPADISDRQAKILLENNLLQEVLNLEVVQLQKDERLGKLLQQNHSSRGWKIKGLLEIDELWGTTARSWSSY